MAANYATVAYCYQTAGGLQEFVPAGATRDSVTDATMIAQFPSNWTTTVPTATTVGALQDGYLTAYPRGTVS
jgi:hypothetical protein